MKQSFDFVFQFHKGTIKTISLKEAISSKDISIP